jgi:acetyl esterase/lipase
MLAGMNRSLFGFAVFVLALSVAYGQSSPAGPKGDPPPAGYTEVMPLYSDAAPGAVGTAPVDVPKIYTYPAAGPGPHPAVVVFPGGGYVHVVTEKEGGAAARWLQAHGVSAFVVLYRVAPRYTYPVPLNDGLRAMRFVRAHAADWSLRPDAIGAWGFSAGGHMTGWLSTRDDAGDPAAKDPVERVSGHPDFAILSYGRVDLDVKIPGTFTMQALTGGMKALAGTDTSLAMIDAINPILHVNKDTSPAFLYSTEGDQTVNSQNASHYFEALHTAGVPAELHIFEEGPHGTGMGQGLKQTELAIWPTLLQHWMQQHRWMPLE